MNKNKAYYFPLRAIKRKWTVRKNQGYQNRLIETVNKAQDRHTIFDLTVPACIRTCTGNTVYTGDLCSNRQTVRTTTPECHLFVGSSSFRLWKTIQEDFPIYHH